MTRSLSIDTDMDSSWGIATGVGVVGGTDSITEHDRQGRPVLRGMVLTRIPRERVQVTAIVPNDGEPCGPWLNLCAKIFGPTEVAHLIIFADAVATDSVETGELVSVSIDSQTQAAKDDYLHFFERAGAIHLRVEVVCCRLTTSGVRMVWTDAQLANMELLSAVAYDIAEAVGSDESVGDGSC